VRRLPIVIAAMALLVAGMANAGPAPLEPDSGGMPSRKKSLGKDYYVVHKAGTDKCSIVGGQWGNKPDGAMGEGSYAGKKYARDALKTFPECKGGDADETSDHKQHDKKKPAASK
jgi:hypothetical protein